MLDKILVAFAVAFLVLPFGGTSVYGQWTSAELTVPRKNLAATSVGTKALFAGGNDQNNNNFSTVDIYDYITGEWTTHTLSKGRQALRATSFGTKAFFAGGVGSGLLANVDVYDDSKTTNQWASFSLATARAHIGIAAAGGKVFFAGGQVSCGSCYTDNIEVYNIDTENFVASLTMRTARGYLTAAAVGSKVLFAGGINSSSAFISEVDIYDTNTGTWTYTNLPSEGRSHLTAVVNGTKVFFAGGRDGSGSGASKDVDIYDVSNGSWQSTSLSEARAYIHSASIGDKVFFGGGYAGTANLPCDLNNPSDPNLPEHIAKTSETLDIYDVTAGQMLPATTLPGGKRFSLAATSVGETQVVFGGGAGPCNEASAVVDIYDIDPLVEITTNFPEELTQGDKISITADEVSKVSSVKVYVRGVSDPDGEFDAFGPTLNGSSFEYAPSLSGDEIGVVYYFEVTDTHGRKVVSETATSYNRYSSGSSKLNIPGLRHGVLESDYQMISIPFTLDQKGANDVFSALGPYDIKKWRLYDYNEGTDLNRELSGSSTIVPGKGYWLIMRNSTSISVGAGTTARKSRGEEFEITLPNGWSFIGNPYNFPISWTDIKNHNPGFSESQQLKTFDGDKELSLKETDVIGAFRGAFAYNSGSTITVKIPVKRNASLGSRIASPEAIDLDAYNWQFPLELTDGMLTNRLGGIGMNKQATLTGLDNFDGLSAPMPEGMGIPGLVFPHPETNMNFSREVVPTQSEYIWNIAIDRGSDKTLTLRWNNENFKESQKQLFLYDPSAQHMVDMKIKNTYTLPPSTSNLQVLMGGQEFINRKRDELLPLFGTPYPNPAVDKVYVPFWIPEADGAMEVSVKVYNSLGAEIKILATDTFQKGGHELVWDLDEQPGMYLIHMKANNQYSKWAKVTVR